MASTEDPKGADAPKSDSSPENKATEHNGEHQPPSASNWDAQYDDAYDYHPDTFPYEDAPSSPQTLTMTANPPAASAGGGGKTPPPKPPARR